MAFFNNAFGAGAIGCGKTMNDLYTKGFNGETWKMDAYLKRDKTNLIWIDPAAAVTPGRGASVTSVLGYDNNEMNLKYRAKCDSNFSHTSELAWTLPLQDGDQRLKVEVTAPVNKDTFIPDAAAAKTKFFYKATLPKITGEAELDNKDVKTWVRGTVCPELGYGMSATYSMDKGALSVIEAGLIGQLCASFGKVAAKFVFTRKQSDASASDSIEIGVLPPVQKIADRNVKTYLRATQAAGKTNLGLAAEVNACPCVDVKVKVDCADMSTMTSAFAATWNAPGGWRIAASIAEVGKALKFGVRFTQGSSPPPL